MILLPVHIIAASIGLLAGLFALAVRKGGRLHRRGGMLFVYAIVAMCASAIVLAVAKAQPVNVMAGLMTSYLAITAVTAVRPPAPGSRRRDIALMVMALVLGSATMATGFAAIANGTGKILGLPSFPFFLFGVLGLSGAFGDYRTLRAGVLRGAPRLSRHLWRMCMALFITAASFFSIKARVAAIFPAPLTQPLARAVPVLLVLVVMFYWLWNVRSRRSASLSRWMTGAGNAPAVTTRPNPA
jgi:uncharacterized membrane protein